MASQVPGGDDYGNLIRVPDQPPLKGGGGGGTFDRMDARVARLEEDMKDVKVILREIQKDMTAIRVDIGELKGKVGSLPTTLQLLMFVIAVLGIAGLAKYFAP